MRTRTGAFRLLLLAIVVALPVFQLSLGGIQHAQEAGAQSSSLPVGSTIEVIDPGLYLRSAPGFSSTVLAKMALGTRGTVLAGPTWADGHPWYKISTSVYGTGWASGKYLRAVTTSSLLSPPADGLSRVITRGVSGRAEIALTFDAGADRGYARQILDLLKRNGSNPFGITGIGRSHRT